MTTSKMYFICCVKIIIIYLDMEATKNSDINGDPDTFWETMNR